MMTIHRAGCPPGPVAIAVALMVLAPWEAGSQVGGPCHYGEPEPVAVEVVSAAERRASVQLVEAYATHVGEAFDAQALFEASYPETLEPRPGEIYRASATVIVEGTCVPVHIRLEPR